jgi:hypothetical protein
MEAFKIIRLYQNGIYNGDSIDMSAIDKAMEYESVQKDMRGVTTQKVLQWFTIMNRKQNEGANNARK